MVYFISGDTYHDRSDLQSIALGFGDMADAAEIVCLGFILAEMEDDLTTEEKSFLSSAVFMGMLCGGLIWGSISDSIGRRKALLLALGINTIAGLLSAASPDINWLIFFRVIAGLGIGGSVPCLFTLGKEIFPRKRSGQLLSVVAGMWVLGALYVALLGWIMLGELDTGWRLFAIASALPSAIAFGFSYEILPESTKYLMTKYLAKLIVFSRLSNNKTNSLDHEGSNNEIIHNHIKEWDRQGDFDLIWGAIAMQAGEDISNFQVIGAPSCNPKAIEFALLCMERADEKKCSVTHILMATSFSDNRALSENNDTTLIDGNNISNNPIIASNESRESNSSFNFSPLPQDEHSLISPSPVINPMKNTNTVNSNGSNSHTRCNDGDHDHDNGIINIAPSSDDIEIDVDIDVDNVNMLDKSDFNLITWPTEAQINQAQNGETLQESFQTAYETFLQLFEDEIRHNTLVLMAVQFLISFGTYGLSTWIATLFEDVGIKNAYMNTFIFSAACIPGNIFSIIYMDYFGPKSMLLWGNIISSFMVLLFAFDMKDGVAVVVSACLFNGISIVGWNALDILVVSSMPLRMRSTAMGTLSAGGRIGAICAQFVNAFLEDNIAILLFVTFACMFTGGLVVRFLQEIKEAGR